MKQRYIRKQIQKRNRKHGIIIRPEVFVLFKDTSTKIMIPGAPPSKLPFVSRGTPNNPF